MHLRELSDADLPALQDLCRRSLREEPTPARLRSLLLDEPGYDSAYHLAFELDGRLVGVALGGVRARPEGPAGRLRLLAVAPEQRRCGVASALLDELEGRLAAAGVSTIWAGGIAPNFLWPGVDLRDTPALCALQARGYERAGEALNMDVDLADSVWDTAADEARLTALGWSVHRAASEDRELLVAWATGLFGEAWAWEARAAYGNEPVSAFVATRDGQIGGFACYEVNGFAGSFGPTGTDPAVRGLGLGRVLLLRCLADMRSLGRARAEIGWVGPLAFYSHVAGARVGRVCWFLRKPLAR